ncbi:MAG: serine/threonine protein kinase [Kiritimatiellae bacterium]|nr:serine/threonine protein kinase [Kiritimatiellia bacterium]
MNIGTQEIEGFLSAHGRMVTGASFSDGEMFGDWRVTAFLGKGGGGEVYRAVHATLGMVAALKVHVPRTDGNVAREEAARTRFVRETGFLAQNAHPAFPRFLGSGERSGFPWYAMELLESRELPSRDGDVAKFLLCVADGVRHLHSLGLVHRDIKPGNILWRMVGPPRRGGRFAASRVPVLADLGLIKDIATSDARLPTSGVTIGGVGTPRYAAPEQLNGDEITPAVDIYALGMLANECFGGKPPSAWARVIRHATAAIPAQRYPSVDAFAKAVRFRHLGGMVTGALVMTVALAALVTLWPMRMATTYREELECNDVECRLEGENVVTSRVERVIVWKCDERYGRYVDAVQTWKKLPQAFRERMHSHACPTNMTLPAEIPLDRDTMHPAARAWFDQRFPTNKTYAVSMPKQFWAIVTNTVGARVVHLGGKTNVFTRPLVLDTKREYWVEGPGVLDAAVAGPTGAVMRLKNCIFLNRTKEPFAVTGVYYFLDGHVYLNFTELDEPDMTDGRQKRLFVTPTDGNMANEIRYKGPETIRELNELLQQERLKRMHPGRVPVR